MESRVKNGLIFLAVLIVICSGHHLRNIIKEPYKQEYYHYPGAYTPTLEAKISNDTKVPHRNYTPDFRLEEPYYTVYDRSFYREYYRPYRLSPHNKQYSQMDNNERAYNLGCYCCTVYRRHHVLATCAILTHRHILTTATATDIVLRNYLPTPNLVNILGIWYDHPHNVYNASTYHNGPSRIHFHPLYRRDYEGNVSHPIPCLYDLSVWATYYPLGIRFFPRVVICQRGGSTWHKFTHTIATSPTDRHFVVGYLFMKAFGRRPMPYYRYGVRTDKFMFPCPKTEWHWFHCIQGEWARLGMDSGGALHLMDLKKTGREDGLIGMCAFTMKLRSKDNVHYFTVLDTHPVIDFLYESYFGRFQYEFLDSRFHDSQDTAPRLYDGYHIAHYYTAGFQPSNYYPPNYRR